MVDASSSSSSPMISASGALLPSANSSPPSSSDASSLQLSTCSNPPMEGLKSWAVNVAAAAGGGGMLDGGEVMVDELGGRFPPLGGRPDTTPTPPIFPGGNPPGADARDVGDENMELEGAEDGAGMDVSGVAGVAGRWRPAPSILDMGREEVIDGGIVVWE